jgi:signal transduction histidine kinase
MDRESPSKSLCDAFASQSGTLDENDKMCVSLLAHELKGQEVLIGYALTILDEQPLTLQEAQKLLKNCLDGMVETVETYKAFHSKNMMTTVSPITQVFHQAMERVKPLADQKQIQLVIENTLSPDVKISESDFRADAMVWNLVQNAVKYSPSGSSVTVSLSHQDTRKGPGLRLKVSDSGIGILPDDQETVLMGYRGKNAEAAGIPGTGFGLGEVHKHAAYARGSMHIQSPLNPENTSFPGTAIWVDLPFATAAEQA